MPDEWTDRSIRGPSAEYLSVEAMARYFGVSVDTISRLVRSGEMPGPVEVSPGTKMFTAEHAIYYSLRIRLRPLFAPEKGS